MRFPAGSDDGPAAANYSADADFEAGVTRLENPGTSTLGSEPFDDTNWQLWGSGLEDDILFGVLGDNRI